LDITFTSITDLTGIEDFIALTSLTCNDRGLTSLDISQNTALTFLSCMGNSLTSLDVTNNTALTNLSCWNNAISSLDVSQNTALTRLDCGDSWITSLDVSYNTALTHLSCGSTDITSLDVSNNTALTSLSFPSAQLTSLDVSNHTMLNYLRCEYNQLNYLNVKNGNNNNFTIFLANNNPDLSCIEVDDAAYSNANWRLADWFFNVDTTSSFSTNCFVGIDEANNNVIRNIYPNPATHTVKIEVTEHNLSYQLIDVMGKTIQQNRLSKNKNNIDVSTIPNGFYTLSVYNTQGIVSSKKLIVAH